MILMLFLLLFWVLFLLLDFVGYILTPYDHRIKIPGVLRYLPGSGIYAFISYAFKGHK